MSTNHADEYHDAMVAMLELIWGEGFMAPGGPGNVENMVSGLALRDREVLDIGCGIGGPALVLARDYGARVTGIDLERPLIERARRRAEQAGLGLRLEFREVDRGALPFADATFDCVMSSGAFTQTEDKLGMFRECYRVLRPGGMLSCYDWMRSGAPYSAAMQEWFRLEGLTYALATLEAHAALLGDAGFVNITTRDASDWYRREVAREYEQIRGPMFSSMQSLLGEAQARHFLENWRAMLAVCESGEMRQGYYRAQRPAVADA